MKADEYENLTELVRAIARKEFKKLGKDSGTSGGNKVITSEKDIRLIVNGTGKIWINDMYFTTEDGKLVIHTASGIREDSL